MAESRSETLITTEYTENTEERVDLAREQRAQTKTSVISVSSVVDS